MVLIVQIHFDAYYRILKDNLPEPDQYYHCMKLFEKSLVKG
jgi:hypothetical protein